MLGNTGEVEQRVPERERERASKRERESAQQAGLTVPPRRGRRDRGAWRHRHSPAKIQVDQIAAGPTAISPGKSLKFEAFLAENSSTDSGV